MIETRIENPAGRTSARCAPPRAEGDTVVARSGRDQAGTAAATVVHGTGQARNGVVVAAIDGDGNAAQIIAYARSRTTLLRVPLRVTHVWTMRGRGSGGLRMRRQERISHADLLLSAALQCLLTPDEQGPPWNGRSCTTMMPRTPSLP